MRAAQDRWGAGEEEWSHFDLILGVTEDLLPVVSNPNAVISPLSKIGTPGKLPSRYNGDGQMVGIAAWTSYAATTYDITRWSRHADYGICLQTRNIRALDVDVEDFDLSLDIEDEIRAYLGFMPPTRRRPDSCKFLLAFRLQGDFTKRFFRTQNDLVEFLATGQQFIAVGTHPKGSRYEWVGGLPADFPEIPAEQFEALWVHLVEKFAVNGSGTLNLPVALDKARNIADINDPLVDFLMANWDHHGMHQSGRLDIVCPFAAGHSTESGPSATSYFPAGVGGIERGHFKCQHASCGKRTDADFKLAVGWTLDGFEVLDVDEPDPVSTPLLQTTHGITKEIANAILTNNTGPRSGKVSATRETVLAAVAIASICGFSLALDVFKDEILLAERPGEWRPFRDDDYYRIAHNLETRVGARFEHVPTEVLRGAVMVRARDAEFDSAIEWINSLVWDGVSRCETFWPTYMATDDTPYARAVGLYTWSALAGRVLQPGVQADMVPVAIGGQGALKTSAVAALVPNLEYHGELDLKKDDDDLARDIRGKLVMEIGELKGVSARDIEHLKAFLTRRDDKWTPKYKEYQTSYARRCLFIATTNDEESLPPDTTGHRRWLPQEVKGTCDVAGIVRFRNQLWAEARELFLTNGVMWQDAERLARPLHIHYTPEDTWLNRIEHWLYGQDMDGPPNVEKTHGTLRIDEVATGALNIPIKDLNQGIQKRIGACLRQLGFARVVRDRRKVWVLVSVKSH